MVTWLPLVRAAAVGWVPLSANAIPLSSPLTLPSAEHRRAAGGSGSPSAVSSGDSRLRLNISGQHFEAWRYCVDRFPDTLLGSDEKEFFFDADDALDII